MPNVRGWLIFLGVLGVCQARADSCPERFARFQNNLDKPLHDSHENNPAAPRVALHDVSLRTADLAAVKALKTNQELTYVTDTYGNLFLIDTEETFEPDSLHLLHSASEDSNELHVVQETGKLKLGPDGKVSLSPIYSLAPQESQDVTGAVQNALTKQDGDLRIAVDALGEQAVTKVIHCTEVLLAQTSVKRAIFDNLIAANAVFGTAVVTSELTGAKRLASRDGRQVLTVDAVGTNINSVTAGLIGKALISSSASLPVAMVTRAGYSLGMIQAQQQFYNFYLDDNPRQRSQAIANFDRAYFVFRLPINQVVDKFVLDSLPRMLYEACKKDSGVMMFITPSTVRIAERYASTVLYYEARKGFIGE